MWGQSAIRERNGVGLAGAAVVEAEPGHEAVRLVAVESGAHWNETLAAPDHSHRTVVIAQRASEAPTLFAMRALRRALALEDSGRSVRRTVLLVAPRFDRFAMSSRLLFARGLFAHSSSMGCLGSELVLRAASPNLLEAQARLLPLMEAMLAEPDSWAMCVSITFHRQVQRS